MIVRILTWIEHRLRPDEGWLPLLLLFIITFILALAVVDVKWVPEDEVVFVTALAGLLLAITLAKRSLGWLPAWLLIFAYGLLVTIAWLGRLVPPPTLMLNGWTPASEHIRHNWALFIDRIGGWLSAALQQGRSEETIVFALGLGLVAWFLAAYAGWATFRQKRPWAGLALLTLALAVNNHYGRAEMWSLPIFVGLLVALVAVTSQVGREADWDKRNVDYSGEIRIDLLFYSGAIALSLLFVSSALPAVNFRAISDAILNRPAVDQTEQTLERLFAGVRQPEPEPLIGDSALVSGARSRSGTLPRAFLLGAPPDLQETVVMTATVRGDTFRANHWRGLSYDIYTGHGWAVSAESRDPIVAGQAIPLPPVDASTLVTQTVARADESEVIRYTLGLPLGFDQPVTVRWRGLEDLSRVQGQGGSYSAVSRNSTASAVQLRSASLANVPPALMARYTALPDSVPDRVFDLAYQVAGESATPYDQAKALETFLRQYPYSLDVGLPPADRDPVDYFLFDQQRGYCDYYASSMVVLARSLGLPARLAAGYLAQPAVDGTQTIRQINAHSWAEVYFAGYGWIEFEPTAAFPAEEPLPPLPGEPGYTDPDTQTPITPPSIPSSRPEIASYLWLLLLIPLVLGGWWLWRIWRQDRQLSSDQAAWAYYHLQRRAGRLGQAAQPSQTPSEFADAFMAHLDQLDRGRFTRQLHLTQLTPEIRQLSRTFADRQYALQKPPAKKAVASWQRIRRQLWLLNLIEDIRGLLPFKQGPAN